MKPTYCCPYARAPTTPVRPRCFVWIRLARVYEKKALHDGVFALPSTAVLILGSSAAVVNDQYRSCRSDATKSAMCLFLNLQRAKINHRIVCAPISVRRPNKKGLAVADLSCGMCIMAKKQGRRSLPSPPPCLPASLSPSSPSLLASHPGTSACRLTSPPKRSRKARTSGSIKPLGPGASEPAS